MKSPTAMLFINCTDETAASFRGFVDRFKDDFEDEGRALTFLLNLAYQLSTCALEVRLEVLKLLGMVEEKKTS